MFRSPFVRRGRFGRSSWTEMEQLQREMNRLFSSAFGESRVQTPVRYPAMNVWTSEESVVVTAELPGVKPLQEGERYHRRERSFGRFSRTFQLPFQVDSEQVEAVLEKGVLHVSLPRAESDKPRKIAIQNA